MSNVSENINYKIRAANISILKSEKKKTKTKQNNTKIGRFSLPTREICKITGNILDTKFPNQGGCQICATRSVNFQGVSCRIRESWWLHFKSTHGYSNSFMRVSKALKWIEQIGHLPLQYNAFCEWITSNIRTSYFVSSTAGCSQEGVVEGYWSVAHYKSLTQQSLKFAVDQENLLGFSQKGLCENLQVLMLKSIFRCIWVHKNQLGFRKQVYKNWFSGSWNLVQPCK